MQRYEEFNRETGIRKMKTVYEEGERYFELDGEKFICVSVETVTQDDTLRMQEIKLRRWIPIQHINFEVKL